MVLVGKNAKRNLHETFNSMEHLYNITDLEKRHFNEYIFIKISSLCCEPIFMASSSVF